MSLANEHDCDEYLLRESSPASHKSSSELQALQRLQNRALSIIERARFKDPWPKKWLSAVNLVCFDRCVMVYKIVNKQCLESLWNMFQQRCTISNYNTRNHRHLHIPKLNLESTKKGFHYSGIKAWNDIPVNIRELPSLRLFKTRLTKHLMSLDDKFQIPAPSRTTPWKISLFDCYIKFFL